MERSFEHDCTARVVSSGKDIVLAICGSCRHSKSTSFASGRDFV